MNKDELLLRLTELDFMAVDLALYLNTNPNDKDMIEKYNDIISEADKHRQMYETSYGPLCSYRSVSRSTWTWVDSPWPWQTGFNPEI